MESDDKKKAVPNLIPNSNSAVETETEPEAELESQSYNSAKTSESRDKVFSNAVVWRTLGKCLNYSDLKSSRRVCRDFNRNIIEETNFVSRVFISLRAGRVEHQVFKPTTVWKHFKVECFEMDDEDGLGSMSEDEGDTDIDTTGGWGDYDGSGRQSESQEGMSMDGIDTDTAATTDKNANKDDITLMEIEPEDDENKNVKEENEKGVKFGWIFSVLKEAESLTIVTMCDPFNNDSVQPAVSRLLEAPTKLKSLKMDVHTMHLNCKELTDPAMSAKIRNTLENLSEFHILPASKTPDDLDFGEEDYFEFPNVLSCFATVFRNLSIFSIPKFSTGRNSNEIEHIHKIIEQNQPHLSTLKAPEPSIWSVYTSAPTVSLLKAQTAPMIFPQLKSLKMVVNHLSNISLTNIRSIVQFLTLQPRLEELELSISPRLPTDIYALISAMVKLRILRLRTKGCDGQELQSWSFLNKLENLEEFHFVLQRSRFARIRADVSSFLANAPKSVRKISLRGFSAGIADPNRPFLIDQLTQLNPLNVTELNLSQCSSFVTDIVMECICRNFRMLRKLNVSRNRSLTNYGFTGIRPNQSTEESSFSIKDLKGLQCLWLEQCDEITDMTLIVAIQFLELNYLNLCGCSQITTIGCKAVLENNPSLEAFKINISFAPKFLEQFRRRRLRPFLDLGSWGELYDSDDDLSDSDAEIIVISDDSDMDDSDDSENNGGREFEGYAGYQNLMMNNYYEDHNHNEWEI